MQEAPGSWPPWARTAASADKILFSGGTARSVQDGLSTDW